eukprot:1678938-Prymnesium_polylepis.2
MCQWAGAPRRPGESLPPNREGSAADQQQQGVQLQQPPKATRRRSFSKEYDKEYDKDLSRAMSNLLRHEAQGLEMAIDREGWMLARDVLDHADTKAPPGKSFKLDDVRAVVAGSFQEGVPRFQLRELLPKPPPSPGGAAADEARGSAHQVRSVTGHTMPCLLRLHSQASMTHSGACFGKKKPGSKHNKSRRASFDAVSGLPMQAAKKAEGRYAHSAVAAKLLARKARGIPMTARERCFLFLEEPQSSRAATWFGGGVVASLMLFAVLSTLETVASLQSPASAWFFALSRIILNALFTIETALRLATHQPLARAHRSQSRWLELLTIAPFWLRVAFDPSSLAPSAYFERSADRQWIHGLESVATLRLLQLARVWAQPA